MDVISFEQSTSFTIINKIIHKLDRFELYSNKKMFYGIFKSGQGEQLFEEFHNKYNRKVIDFYGSLTCEQRILFTSYLQSF